MKLRKPHQGLFKVPSIYKITHGQTAEHGYWLLENEIENNA